MNPVIERMQTSLKELPLARKIALGVLIVVMIAGFATMFVWANKTEYKAAYTGLTAEDAAEVVARLKETNIPYRLEGGGSVIMVPALEVYDVRLSMAKEGIPKGSGVGYEIFDKTDFGTTEFVQKINRKRALQGELARTIRAFDEVKDARVMIVLPKDSVFVEETKKPSASILLELESDIDEVKVASIAHLVASSIEDLTPKLVTIVDTTGRILFEGKSEEEKAQLKAQDMANTQYKHKVRFETTMSERIQTMLERIVGKDKAIVRVSAKIDFSDTNTSEEIYDPFERETTFVRSKKIQAENARNVLEDMGEPSSVNPVVPPGEMEGGQGTELLSKKNDTVNFEISKRVQQIIKPMAVLKRLSVAAVVDGKYELKTDDSGNKIRTYVPRDQVEMQQFNDIVVRAMGYDEEREDQVTVECFPFASIADMEKKGTDLVGWQKIQKEYGRTMANILLVILLFLLVVRPLVKTVRGVKDSVEEDALKAAEEQALLEAGEDGKEPDFAGMDGDEQQEYLNSMNADERVKFLDEMTLAEQAAYLMNLSVSEKAQYYARKDVNKTSNIIKGWLSENKGEEEE